ncbi:MAG: hypothetical protein WC979_01680 [Candidatus Pacearchaeota archaeon]|jgi:hypothetical protein|nr:hypothetical protein [Clostridia bacterium]
MSTATAKKHYSRRERKQLEKTFNLVKPTDPKERAEFQQRRMEMGKQLNLQFKESVINEQDKQAVEKEAKILRELMADVVDHKGNFIRKGKTYEEAKAFVLHNYEIERKRLEKQAAKIEKQNQILAEKKANK